MERGDGYVVLENACLSHVDASVLVWDSAPLLDPGSIAEVAVRYHPFRANMPGHKEYRPLDSHRTVLVRAAPAGAIPPSPHRQSSSNVQWRGGGGGDAVAGALLLGTFTMGAGTTASRPGFDMFSSTWHGFLEPLVDAWAHVRRLNGVSGSASTGGGTAPLDRKGTDRKGAAPSLAQCPRYDVFLTDEVLGTSAEWERGYLVAFWRALATHTSGGGGGGLRSLLDLTADATRPYAAADAAPWHVAARGPLTCYDSVVVGGPCCSGYPFNGRGGEDLLGPFGDCMVEAALRDASQEEARSPWAEPWVGGGRVLQWGRRAAVASAARASVLVLDRDECDRRLTSDSLVALVASLRGLGLGTVRHVFFERLTRAEQLRAAAGADLVRLGAQRHSKDCTAALKSDHATRA